MALQTTREESYATGGHRLPNQGHTEPAMPVHGMTAAIETITVAMASASLTYGNAGNRPLSEKIVAKYARVMLAETWDGLNGEPLIFDTGSAILDGQHRLAAIVRANRPLTTLVVRNVDPRYRRSIDTGQRRTASNVLAMRGEKHATIIASALRWVLTYERRGIGTSRGSIQQFDTVADLETFLAEHPRIRQAALWGARMSPLLNPSIGAFTTYLFAQQDAILAERVVDGIADGALGEACMQPIFFLREKLIRERKSVRHYEDPTIAAFVIIAWNALRQGRTLKLLRWTTEGATPEKFPLVL